MPENKFSHKIEGTLAALKDFQRATVDYVFGQMWGKEKRSKMLIADEVGLGKTIVAKGLIAKAYGAFRPKPNKSIFRVVYICSNQALAGQNLKKLNFSEDATAIDYSAEDDRLTALAYEPRKSNTQLDFSIKAFTPATSFDNKTSAGKRDERILLYRLLYQYADIALHKNSLKWILKTKRGNEDTWCNLISRAEDFDVHGRSNEFRAIRSNVYKLFRASLEKQVKPSELPKCFTAVQITYPVKYWTLLRNLCALGARRNNYIASTFDFCRELISSLRFTLSQCCVEFLDADIFVLDEFQRYKELIKSKEQDDQAGSEETVSPAIQLAREIFAMPNIKVLMLSATPFKPYTNGYDIQAGEVHHQEFDTVLRFLLGNKAGETFWKEHQHDRAEFFRLLRHPQDIALRLVDARALKSRLESYYRQGLVRTERLLVSEEKGTMIETVQKPIEVRTEDIADFVALDAITRYLNDQHGTALNIPLEYVKSCPFPLTFLDNYQHKEKLRRFAAEDNGLAPLLNASKPAWLNLSGIKQYKPLLTKSSGQTPNAKLRLLLDETVLKRGWQYLWVPPTMPYYKPKGAYRDSEGWSKTLLFSSWKMVPRMVAALVSYEAERLSVGNPTTISEREQTEERREYFGKRRSPRPQFTFKVERESGEPEQMNQFSLSYPCYTLASMYDPAQNLSEGKSLAQIRRDLTFQIVRLLNDANLNQYANGEGSWESWKWIAPLMLDKLGHHNELMAEWFAAGIPGGAGEDVDGEDDKDKQARESGRERHFRHAAQHYFTDALLPVGKLDKESTAKLAAHLCELCLASPAVTFLRVLLRYFEVATELCSAAYTAANAFFALLNKPESIAIVRLQTDDSDYTEQCLGYMADGNIQAMLDEYIYMLTDSEGLKTPAELTEFIQDVLGIRTVPLDVEGLREFKTGLAGKVRTQQNMRSHYAVAFGTKINVRQGARREINLRQAFNSPFRPFVLATTSIGQEGLDFHYYCKKIFHWNLPSNPIDFEQREGRIHRYKGLVIRQNLAAKWGKEAALKSWKDIWKSIFETAEAGRENSSFSCDLIPFWHTPPLPGLSIERFVPLYPFSQDRAKYDELIRVLSFYRLTFGQPRQDELIEAMESIGIDKGLHQELYKLMIDLSPISFMAEKPQSSD